MLFVNPGFQINILRVSTQGKKKRSVVLRNVVSRSSSLQFYDFFSITVHHPHDGVKSCNTKQDFTLTCLLYMTLLKVAQRSGI